MSKVARLPFPIALLIAPAIAPIAVHALSVVFDGTPVVRTPYLTALLPLAFFALAVVGSALLQAIALWTAVPRLVTGPDERTWKNCASMAFAVLCVALTASAGVMLWLAIAPA